MDDKSSQYCPGWPQTLLYFSLMTIGTQGLYVELVNFILNKDEI